MAKYVERPGVDHSSQPANSQCSTDIGFAHYRFMAEQLVAVGAGGFSNSQHSYCDCANNSLRANEETSRRRWSAAGRLENGGPYRT